MRACLLEGLTHGENATASSRANRLPIHVEQHVHGIDDFQHAGGCHLQAARLSALQDGLHAVQHRVVAVLQDHIAILRVHRGVSDCMQLPQHWLSLPAGWQAGDGMRVLQARTLSMYRV